MPTARERFEIPVTLKDGRTVGSWSEEWRIECYERWLARPPASSIKRMGRSHIVTLCQSDIEMGEHYGKLRDSESRKRGNQDRHGAKLNQDREQSIATDIMGVHGEIASARVIGVDKDWRPTVNAPRGAPDIPPDWQVRTTDLRSGRLIFRPSENPDQRFILVIASHPRYEVVGFLHGMDCMKPEWFRDAVGRKAPVWWVDRQFLNVVERGQT